MQRPLKVYQTVEDFTGQFVIVERQDLKCSEGCVLLVKLPGRSYKTKRNTYPWKNTSLNNCRKEPISLDFAPEQTSTSSPL